MIEAGKLNQKITFQHSAIVRNELNEPEKTWINAFSTRAEVSGIGTRALYQAQKVFEETSIVFRIRYTERVNMRLRIGSAGRIYRILGINPDALKTEIIISAKEVV